MKQLMSLLRAAMSQDMDMFKIKNKNETRMSKMLLPIVLSLILMFSIGSYVYMLAEKLAPFKLTYIILTIFIMMMSLFTVIEGVYKSQGILFEVKDNDLLFSLPISKSKIFFIRIFKFITFEFLYNSLFMLPVIVVYAMFENPSISFYLLSFLMLLLLPIIPTILASIIGYFIKGLSSRFKAKNIAQVIFTSFMLLSILYISFNVQEIIKSIVQNADSINSVITKIYYPAGLYLNLIQKFNSLDLFILIVINIIPFFLFIYAASVFYFKIISKSLEKGNYIKKINSKKISEKTFKVRAQLSGLINKEMKRFFSTPVFIINAGFGMLLMLVSTIAISVNFDGMVNSMIQGKNIGLSLSVIEAILPKMFYAFVVFTSCMTSLTSSMISLEGKSFNLTKSLPVAPEKILLAKIITSNIITIPVVLLSDIIFFIRFNVPIIDIVFILLASFIMPIFTAIGGLLMNLKYPKMDATSDTEIVKQSMSSTVSVFMGIGVFMLSIAVMFLAEKVNLNINWIIFLELLMFSLVVLILWKVLKSYGVKRWKEINI